MNKKEGTTNIGSGGFHRVWLMPLEALGSVTILTLGLKYGLVTALTVAVAVMIGTYKLHANRITIKKTAKLIATDTLAVNNNLQKGIKDTSLILAQQA